MRFITHILLLTIVLAAMAGCSSDSTVTPIEDYVEQQPMSFSIATLDEGTGLSRATQQPLEAGFLVSTYKLYGAATQQTVMNRYEASYLTTNNYHGSKWNTVGEAGAAPDYFYQTQYERYWDLSAFPYRFHAITPCPKTADNSKIITGFELSDKKLTIPDQYDDGSGSTTFVTYDSQTVSNGTITPDYVPDPYLIAQVQRDDDGKDWDMLQPVFNADGDITSHKTKIDGTGSTERTRAVPLVFHHINSKVRFAIFTNVDAFPDEPLTIKNVTITAKNTSTQFREFITAAANFSASLSGVANDDKDNFFNKGRYISTHGASIQTLLSYTTNTKDLREANTRDKAFFFDIPSTIVGYKDGGSTPVYGDIYNSAGIKTPGGMLQIPQNGVKLFVEFDINNEHYSFQFETQKSNGTTQSVFNWRASCRYTYYIVVTHLKPFEITFTSTIEPWVVVKSSEIGTDRQH